MRPSYVEIDLRAIAHNVRSLSDHVAPADVCAVVKADAYGHGDVPVAEVAVQNGARWLAVALVEEGVRLREGGIEAPVLLLSEPPTGSVNLIREWDLTPTVYSEAFLDALLASGNEREAFGVEIKLDTGMHRVGADVDAAISLAKRIEETQHLSLDGVWTHLSVADEDSEYTKLQLERFDTFVSALRELRITPDRRHVSNTAGSLTLDSSSMTSIRTGLGIYGLYPFAGYEGPVDLRPALSIFSAVSHVSRHAAGERPSYGRIRALERDAFVVTVPIGYADGVPRRLGSVGGEVLIGGRRFPLAGTVTMDQLVVDTGDTEFDVGQEVVVLGTQGSESITADDWASMLDTISYEIICQLGPRLPRRYVR